MFGQDEAAIAAKADSLHKVFFTIDTHNDYAIFACHPDSEDYSVEKGQVSFPMMVEGGLDAGVFAIYMGQEGRSQDSLQLAVEYGVRELTLFKEFVQKNFSDYVEIAYSSDDLLRIKKEGKRAVLLSLENAYMLGNDIKNVEMFYNLGIRLITLCHFGDNDICDSARKSSNEHGGVSQFGADVIREMNRLGMMVDLSHASEKSFYDAMDISQVPIVCSHSSCRSLCDHPRNLTDGQMKSLAGKGGVMQVTFYEGFLRQDSKASVLDAIEHINHAVNIMGIEHVGIGTDFDGDGGVPGLAHAGELINLTRALLRERYSGTDLRLLWGENFLRVMREAQGFKA